MLVVFLAGVVLAMAVMAVIYLAVLTVKWAMGEIKKRLAARKRHKVVFADMRETVDAYVREHADRQAEISMDDLEELCRTTPYVIADYDIDTGKVEDFTGIKADRVESGIKSRLKKEGGMVVLNG